MTRAPYISRTQRDLRSQIWKWRGSGDTIAFVPTMGALHEGHLSLVRLAKEKADRVVVSIFVNPTQFGPGEDFESYPRSEDIDMEKLTREGCDLVYIPRDGSMYNAHHATRITVGGVAEGLETRHRPTFFDGVALVVTKLLNRVMPDVAVFGEKDYQQLATIRRLVADLDMPVEIVSAPIARDAHGLALSSRNAYLDARGLATAQHLNGIMRYCASQLAEGHPIEDAVKTCEDSLKTVGFERIDYVSVAHAETLSVMTSGKVDGPARLLIAAYCKGVRLIDNCAV